MGQQKLKPNRRKIWLIAIISILVVSLFSSGAAIFLVIYSRSDNGVLNRQLVCATDYKNYANSIIELEKATPAQKRRILQAVVDSYIKKDYQWLIGHCPSVGVRTYNGHEILEASYSTPTTVLLFSMNPKTGKIILAETD